MSLLCSTVHLQLLPSLSAVKPTPNTTRSLSSPSQILFSFTNCSCVSSRILPKPFAASSNSNPVPDEDDDLEPKKKFSGRPRKKPVVSQNEPEGDEKTFPSTLPRKPRRGRRGEAAAVEDFVRDSLEKTFASIREQNPDICIEKERIFKERLDQENSSDISDDDDDDDDDEDDQVENPMMVEEEDPNWPLDADVGWGTRASEYFEKHAIKNVVEEDGTEIDWEGEIDDNWVQEINCLEWERFAFHPSPLIVLVFERYNRAADNWKVLKELEKALKVYWGAKDRLPPRAVKIDINIERDLAYALKVRECPQILFLRGHSILYREKELRTAEDLVQMIAFFYYNAKKPSWIDKAALAY